MGENFQMSFDDMNRQATIQSSPGRAAYIDEFGSFGFDFNTVGTSKYYILCAIVVENSDLDYLHSMVNKVKCSNGFNKAEMKSSAIGNNDNRRKRIVSQLLPISFRMVILIADKQEFIKGSPLTEYKKSFIKYLHQRLYDLLYHVYPKLKIIEDEIGSSEFQLSFREYVKNNRPTMNFFNEYDFDYTDSKDELLVQLADVIGGSIGHFLQGSSKTNYLEMLKGKILVTDEFPNKREPYWGAISPEEVKFDKDIYLLSVKCASDYVEKHETDDSDDIRAQVALLRYLLFQVMNVNPTTYITSYKLLSVIREYTDKKVTKNYLFRHVVAPLRDNGVIIASCSRGYKIPISVEDVITYLNQTHTIVSPMLYRMGMCRNLIKQQTGNSLDVLDDSAFLKYKKYFD